MEIIIGGDLVPTLSNISLFEEGDITTLLGVELLSLWNSVDFRVFNLEVPLTDNRTPIEKCGPSLFSPISVINGIKAMNPSLVLLANNHILDQGKCGFDSTKKILNKYDIPFVGAGDNIYEASRPFIINKDNMKIGIYACTEHEFTIATENSPGANLFDPFESLDHIIKLKNECNYVIVIYHGGKEHYRYPSPYLQKVCRKIAQKGADLVICQHSHCIGAYEQIGESRIIYGQGNLLFDYSENEFWQTSLLIRIRISNKFEIDYIPIKKYGKCIKLAFGKTSEDILKTFYQRSSDILKPGFIQQKYEEFAGKELFKYFRYFAGYGKWLSRIDRLLMKGLLIKLKYKKNQLQIIQNIIECEAHKELIIAGLKNKK